MLQRNWRNQSKLLSLILREKSISLDADLNEKEFQRKTGTNTENKLLDVKKVLQETSISKSI